MEDIAVMAPTKTPMVLMSLPTECRRLHDKLKRTLEAHWNTYVQAVLNGRLVPAAQSLQGIAVVLSSPLHSASQLMDPGNAALADAAQEVDASQVSDAASSLANESGPDERWEYVNQYNVLPTIVQYGLRDEPCGLLRLTCRFCAQLAGQLPVGWFAVHSFRTPLLSVLQSVSVRAEGDRAVVEAVVRMAAALCLLMAEQPTRLSDLFVISTPPTLLTPSQVGPVAASRLGHGRPHPDELAREGLLLECPPVNVLWAFLQRSWDDDDAGKLRSIALDSLTTLCMALDDDSRAAARRVIEQAAASHWLSISDAQHLQQGVSWLTIPMVSALRRELGRNPHGRAVAWNIIRQSSSGDFIVPCVAHVVNGDESEALSAADAFYVLAKCPEYFFVPDSHAVPSMTLPQWKALVDPLTRTLEDSAPLRGLYEQLDMALKGGLFRLRTDGCRRLVARLLCECPDALGDVLAVLRDYPLGPTEPLLVASPAGDGDGSGLALLRLFCWQRLALNGIVRIVHGTKSKRGAL